MKFKLFMCVAVVLIILLQAAIVGLLIYGGMKANNAANSVKGTINNFTSTTNSNLNRANTNLSKIGRELQNTPTIPSIP